MSATRPAGAKKRALVVGAGPAGLATGVRLLEEARGELDVTLVHMGHHVGGKAASYVDGYGRAVEHGWHMVLGFYKRLRALMRRAGVDEARALASMAGKSHAFEPSTGRVATLDSTGGRVAMAARFTEYAGMPVDDRMHYARFMAQTYALVLAGEDLTKHDDVCFTRWAIDRGLRPHVARYAIFRLFREGYFNFPDQISAYHVLQTMKLMSTSEDAEAFCARGPWSERVWSPIARYFESLGGKILPYTMVRALVYEGRKVRALEVARPDPSGHAHGRAPLATPSLRIEEGTARRLSDFEFVVSAIPQAVFVTLGPDDTRLWGSPYFARMKNLRSVATVSLTVRTAEPTFDWTGPVHGLPAPLGIGTNMSRYLDAYRGPGARAGTEVQFVGQEAGFERWSDDEITSFTLDNFAKVPGCDLRKARITYAELHRNRSDFERIFACEPGVQRFRPGPLTPFDNLFMAGDWVRNDVDVVCMEGAVASGYAAADALLGRLSA